MTMPHLDLLRALSGRDAATVAGIVAGTIAASLAVRWLAWRVADGAPSPWRLAILRIVPIVRLAIGIAGVALTVPVLVEPNFEDIVALATAVGLALAFALKDYVSSLAAGLVVILERTYQPGDWIEIDGAYGEVKAIGLRAAHIVTIDDTEVVVPHAKLWTASIANATSGSHSVLCIANFYLDANHDGAAVCAILSEAGSASPWRRPDSRVIVAAAELPWGTHYKLKVFAGDSREQFTLITDLTLRVKAKLREAGVAFARADVAVAK